MLPIKKHNGGTSMKSNTILLVFVIIIVIAAISYVIGVLMKRRNEEKLKKLEQRKLDLFDLPVFDEVDEIKKMHLVGQSQNTFREWSQKWEDISTSSFAELESRIFEVENLNETFRFFNVKDAIAAVDETMTEMETEVAEIRQGLKELKDSEERNSLAVQEALDQFGELNEQIKNESDSFGPALLVVQEKAEEIEKSFKQFVNLNSSGDPMEARTVLVQAEEDTYALADLVDDIPPLVSELTDTFPGQLDEIEAGYNKLLEQHYQFPTKDLPEEVRQTRGQIDDALSALKKMELTEVQNISSIVTTRIDQLYERLEKEIEARQYVEKNLDVALKFVAHVMKNNRNLMIELDHTSQSYTLNNNELGMTRSFQTQLDGIERKLLQIQEHLKDETVIYSESAEAIEASLNMMEDTENQQVEISDSLKNLRKDEEVAAEKIETYEFKLRRMKRYVDQQRLPGVPQEYLEFFFVATDRVEELSRELSKIRIDMDEINQLVAFCDEDMLLLDEKTNELVDSAALTEQMLQYANRYRHSHPQIEQAINKSLHFFTEEYRYQTALDEIGVALEAVEPGAFKRIESIYFQNKEMMY